MTQLNLLINRFLDDQRELSPDELDALIAGLRAEPGRAAELREQLVVDDLLAQKLTLDRRNFLAQVQQRIADFERSEEEIDQQVAELHSLAAAPVEQPSQWSGNSTWIKGALALSLVALVAGFYIVPQFLPRRAHVVAKVIQVGGPVATVNEAEKTSLSPAEPLFVGQQIESPAGGSLALEYADQTELRITGDSLVTLDEDPDSSAKRVRIERGELWADVAKQIDGPMQFITPHAIATVLGTQLRLTVTDDDTLLEVSEGEVRLEHAGDQAPIDVAAEESGLATEESLDLRTVRWPDDDTGLAYAFDPFVRRVPRTRNPATGNWLSNPLEAIGSAAVNDFTDALELSGGFFRAIDEGPDIVTVSRSSREFALEIVFAPLPGEQFGPARIVGLEGSDGSSSFSLSQEKDELIFALRTDSDSPRAPLRFALDDTSKPGELVHLTITCREGQVAVYQAGRKILQKEGSSGSLAAWEAGPLAIGADSRGQMPWKGTIESLAIYHRCLDPEEVARNVHAYRILSGRAP